LRRSRILVVDDTEDIRYFLATLLQDRYEVIAAASGEACLQAAVADKRPEIILLDVVMPGMDGYEVMSRLANDARTADIPVIFLTALSSVEEEQRGLDLGATDYITKPISPPILLARVQAHLALKANADFLRDKSEYLEQQVAKRTQEVQAIQDVTIMAMASLAETRDNETGNHIRRTQFYVKRLALQQPEQKIQRRGPPVAAAFDKSGAPTRAATAFAESCGVLLAQLGRETDAKGNAALSFSGVKPGVAAALLLPGLSPS
jgi:putative two-component system response regulator